MPGIEAKNTTGCGSFISAFERGRFPVKRRRRSSALAYFAIISLLIFVPACGPSASENGPQGPAKSSTAGPPELDEQTVQERLSGVHVRKIPDEAGVGEPLNWTFFEDEPREVKIADRQVDGGRATLILDIRTTSSPRATKKRYLAGQIRTEWQLETGWVLRRWEVVRTENISMKYRIISEPPAQNSNQ